MSLYISGLAEDGRALLAGVWRMKHQDGFPLEMSHLIARDKGMLIDWMEAMADASVDNNLPALWAEVEQILSEDQQTDLKVRFMVLLKHYANDYAAIVKMKRDKGEEYRRWQEEAIKAFAPTIHETQAAIADLKDSLS